MTAAKPALRKRPSACVCPRPADGSAPRWIEPQVAGGQVQEPGFAPSRPINRPRGTGEAAAEQDPAAGPQIQDPSAGFRRMKSARIKVSMEKRSRLFFAEYGAARAPTGPAFHPRRAGWSLEADDIIRSSR